MLQTVVEKLTESPKLVEQIRRGDLRLEGISETEQAALIDVFDENQAQTTLGICYWK